MRIIANGDRINHAIFTREELENGLNVLINNDFVHLADSMIYATEKAKQLYKKHRKFFEGYIEEWIRFSDILCKYPFVDSQVKLYHLSEDDYSMAIAEYDNHFSNLLSIEKS